MAKIKVITNDPSLTKEDIDTLVKSFCDDAEINPEELGAVKITLPETKNEPVPTTQKPLEVPFHYESINVYDSEGNIVEISPDVYNTVNAINANLVSRIACSNSRIDQFDAATIRRAIDDSVMMALNSFILTVHNRYAVMIGKLNYLFVDPDSNISQIVFEGNKGILNDLDMAIPIARYMELNSAERLNTLNNGSFTECVITAINRFGYEAFNDIRRQMNTFLETSNINGEILKDFFNTVTAEIGSMMADIVFEQALFFSNLGSAETFLSMNDDVSKECCRHNFIEF